MIHYATENGPDCCWFCKRELLPSDEIAVDAGDRTRVHQGCLDQHLYDEWMAERAVERHDLGLDSNDAYAEITE